MPDELDLSCHHVSSPKIEKVSHEILTSSEESKQEKNPKLSQRLPEADKCKPAIVRLCRVDAPAMRKGLKTHIICDFETKPISSDQKILKDHSSKPVESGSDINSASSTLSSGKKSVPNLSGSPLSKHSNSSAHLKNDSPKKSSKMSTTSLLIRSVQSSEMIGDNMVVKQGLELKEDQFGYKEKKTTQETDKRSGKIGSGTPRTTRGRTKNLVTTDKQNVKKSETEKIEAAEDKKTLIQEPAKSQSHLVHSKSKSKDEQLDVHALSKVQTETCLPSENKELSVTRRTRSGGLKRISVAKESENITENDEAKQTVIEVETILSNRSTKVVPEKTEVTENLVEKISSPDILLDKPEIARANEAVLVDGKPVELADENNYVSQSVDQSSVKFAEAAKKNSEEPASVRNLTPKEENGISTRRGARTRSSPMLLSSNSKRKRDLTAESEGSETGKDSKSKKISTLKANVIPVDDKAKDTKGTKDDSKFDASNSEGVEKDIPKASIEKSVDSATQSTNAEASTVHTRKSSRKSTQLLREETPVTARTKRISKKTLTEHADSKTKKVLKEEISTTLAKNLEIAEQCATDQKEVYDHSSDVTEKLVSLTNLEEDEPEILPLHMRLGIDSSYSESSVLAATPDKDQKYVELVKSSSSPSLDGSVVTVGTSVKEDSSSSQAALLEEDEKPFVSEELKAEVNESKNANGLVSKEDQEGIIEPEPITLPSSKTDIILSSGVITSEELSNEKCDSDDSGVIQFLTPSNMKQDVKKSSQTVDLVSENKVRTRTSLRRAALQFDGNCPEDKEAQLDSASLKIENGPAVPVTLSQSTPKEDANGIAEAVTVENSGDSASTKGTLNKDSAVSKQVKLSKRKSLPANTTLDNTVKKPKRVSFGGKGLKEKTADQRFDDMLKRTAKPGTTRRKRGSFGVILATPSKKMAVSVRVKPFPKARRHTTGSAVLSKGEYDSSDDDISAILLRTYSGGKSPARKSVPLPKRSTMMKHIKGSLNTTTTKQVNTQNQDVRSPQSVKMSPAKSQCQFHICCQGPSPPEMRSPTTMYNCKECHYRTCRIENIIQHYKECTLMLNQDTLCWDKVGDKTPTRFSQEALKSSPSLPAATKDSLHGSSRARRNLSKNLGDLGKVNSNDEKETGGSEKGDDISDGAESDCADNLSSGGSSKTTFGFDENDIVWVDWKNDHWPALVQKIFPKQRKALVYLIENQVPDKGIKIQVRKLTPFDDATRNKQYLSKGGPNSAKVKAVQKAEDYLRKRVLGMKINPMQFFNNPSDVQGYLLGESDEETSPSFGMVTCPTTQAETLPDENAETLCPAKFSSPSKEELDRIRQRLRAENRKIMDCINEGQVEGHLIDVFQSRVSSVRHDKFHSSDDSVRDQLRHGTWFGPLETEDQRDEIIEYCMSLFKEKFDKQDNFDIVAYVFEVWIPEALIQAMMKVYNIAAAEAEARFARGSDWLPQDLLLHQEAEELCQEPGLLDPLSSKRQMVIEKLRAIGIQEELLQTVPPTPLYRPGNTQGTS